jgi:hypothetical protein
MFQFPALLSVTCSATPSTRKGNTCRAEPLQKRLTYREQIGPAGFSLPWSHGAQRLTSVPTTPTPGCDCCASAFACGVKRRLIDRNSSLGFRRLYRKGVGELSDSAKRGSVPRGNGHASEQKRCRMCFLTPAQRWRSRHLRQGHPE